MRIALCQINPTVGDVAGNCRKILHYIDQARAGGAHLAVFPELSICGYPPKDLLLKPQFIEDNLRALRLIASRVKGIDALVGYAQPNESPVGRPMHNAAALLRDGQVISRHYKTLMPTYDVFDESRYFEPGPPRDRGNLLQVRDQAVGLSICEDLWNDEKLISRRLYHQNPIADLSAAGARLLVNLSASPFVAGKQEFRAKLFSEQVKHYGVPLVYVNQVGGNDELVFDGNSLVIDSDGRVRARAKSFAEDLLIVEMDGPAEGVFLHAPTAEEDLRDIHDALVLGLRDYVHKCGFKSVVLGLSGGIDSALTAALAVDALGAQNVLGVSMPSRYSSQGSITDAQAVAQNLGIRFETLPIALAHEAYEKTLTGIFTGYTADVTEENLQARIRGAMLMALSNKFNCLLLTTGNKSELAVGYCTLYGDMCGGLAVISDVPKVVVYQLSHWINQQAGRLRIPQNSITKPPSAELRPNQCDQDSLPPYDILDGILQRYIEEEKGVAQIIAEGYDPATVLRIVKLVDRSEYKRRQAAPGLKVTTRAFGMGRRMPIAQNYQQALPES